jgi:hypothetical protein
VVVVTDVVPLFVLVEVEVEVIVEVCVVVPVDDIDVAIV